MKKKMTLLDAIIAFKKSNEWRGLSVSTKRIHEQGLRIAMEFWGDDIEKIDRPMMYRFKDRNFDHPGRCKTALSALSAVFRFAHNNGWIIGNPAANLSNLPKSTPHKRWTDAEIDRFIETAPDYLGTAIMAALYTGQRRGDLVKMRWSDYDGETIHLVQQKTGKELTIYVHPKLRAALDRAGRVGPYLLRNSRNEPWCGPSLHRAVSRHAKAIGLHDRTLHGIRKSTASKLAELGCTPHQIMSVTGHSMKEANNYSREASTKILSQQAMETWQR
jgi:integrase